MVLFIEPRRESVTSAAPPRRSFYDGQFFLLKDVPARTNTAPETVAHRQKRIKT